VEVFDQGAHPFAFLVDITDKDVRGWFVVMEDGNYEFNGPEVLLRNLGLDLPEAEEVILNVNGLFQ